VDSSDTKSSFSNYGDYIDIAAPGQSIYTTKKGGGYGAWNGTSFAAPIVSGVLGLIFARNPSLSVGDAKQILLSNADNLGTPTYYGAGRVNAARAVEALDNFTVNQPPVITLIEPSDNAVYMTTDLVTFRATALDAEDGDLTARITWVSDRDGVLGNGGSFSDYLSEGTHTITAQVTDTNGQMSAVTITVVVNAPQPINAPSNLAATASGLTVRLTWKDRSNNETGFVIERAVKSSAPSFAVVGVVAANVKSYKDATPSPATYLYRVRAYNSQSVSSYSNTVTVATTTSNQDPTLSILSPTSAVELAGAQMVAFEAQANDPEEGNISSRIIWKLGTTAIGNGPSCSAFLNVGTHTISASVSDSFGATASSSITVVITEPPLAAPINFFGRTTYVGPLQCRLYWTDGSNGQAEGYVLEFARVPEDGSQPQFAVAAVLPPDAAKRYVDTRDSAGLYRYRVRAFKGSRQSDYSETIDLRLR
jgi:hypothetical protein